MAVEPAPALLESAEVLRPVAGHCIRDAEMNILGYAAVTGDQVWSLYDPDMEQVGVLSRAAGSYTVFWLGGRAESSSMLSVEAETSSPRVRSGFGFASRTQGRDSPSRRRSMRPKPDMPRAR